MLKKFWIVTNDGKDTNHAVTEKVKELLEIAGRSCILCSTDVSRGARAGNGSDVRFQSSETPHGGECTETSESILSKRRND